MFHDSLVTCIDVILFVMRKLILYLNPMAHLGERDYPVVFPLLANFLLCILSEILCYVVLRNPSAVGSYIIFVNVAFILYFAFRSGLRGGYISSFISILYYFYIIFTRNYSGSQLVSALQTTAVLAVLFFSLAGIIGWLKQQIDKLIQQEADGKRRLEAIIQQLPVGVLITDSEGQLVQRNSQIDSILGMEIPIGFRLGKDTLSQERVDGQAINPSESPLFNSLRTGKPIIGKELMFERRDGKVLFLQVSSAPIRGANDTVIAAASIISDITKQKELERQKDDFIGMASHELKTPVTSLKVYAQSLESSFRKHGDVKAAEQLHRMDIQLDRLTNLISDMLDVTKIQSGRLQFTRTDFDFNSLVQEKVEELQLTSTQHKLDTELGEMCFVHADRERIGQVITNFITNAIKYSPHSDKIFVKSFVEKGEVLLLVQDFGVGIPSDKHHRVFEQFFRVSGPNQNTYPGLGLGLYISAEIIKRESGAIWVESEEGKGSSFYFRLPILNKR